MEYTSLKNTSIEVSRLCFGGCPMGQHGWGDVSRDGLIDAVRTAVDLGVNFFDTADVYGLGEGERTLSEALGQRRNEVVIASKFGVRVENGKTFYDNSPEWIEKALHSSLNRLKTDYIDLYQMHYRDGITPISMIIEKLEQLKQRGHIRSYGLSNVYAKDIPELLIYKDRFVSFQNEFSLANRNYEEDIRSVSDDIHMTPMTWGSLGQGVLTGKYDLTTKFDEHDRRSRAVYTNFHGEKFEQNMRIVDELRKISLELNKSIPAIAIRWLLDWLPESVVLAGIKTKKQLLSNIETMDWKLDDSKLIILDKVSSCKVVNHDK